MIWCLEVNTLHISIGVSIFMFVLPVKILQLKDHLIANIHIHMVHICGTLEMNLSYKDQSSCPEILFSCVFCMKKL